MIGTVQADQRTFMESVGDEILKQVADRLPTLGHARLSP